MKVSYCERRIHSGRFLWAFALLAGLLMNPFAAGSVARAQTPPPNKKQAKNGPYRVM